MDQGKTVGVVGPGRIGFAYAKMMVEGHKMNILYNSHEPQPEIADYFKAEEITVRGHDVPKPVLAFTDWLLSTD